MRTAFKLKLKTGGLPDYIRLHEEIWPELVEEEARHGITQVTIFLSDNDMLIIYSEHESATAWPEFWNTEIHRRWAEKLEPFLELSEDGTPASWDLTEIWHLEPRSS